MHGIVPEFAHLVRPQTQVMAKPFMIRFPFKGRGCYANVYVHEAKLKEYHVHIIEPELHLGLPPKIVLILVEGRLHLAEPLTLSKTVLSMLVEEIQKKKA
jgi:hypothetical protein